MMRLAPRELWWALACLSVGVGVGWWRGEASEPQPVPTTTTTTEVWTPATSAPAVMTTIKDAP